ncbi:hypothetical protein P167DRAFT_500243, partial [Morchella conica CCBAS932]
MSARLLFTRSFLKPTTIHLNLLRHTLTVSSRMSTAAPPPAVPRLSASLLIINPLNEILLLHRPSHSSTFPNAHVFPGGATSPSDPPPAHTALRETFEETGLLLTTPPPPPSLLPSLPLARSQIHAGTLSFTDFLAAHSLTPAVDELIPFTTWITPKAMKRRFETHMFLYFLPSSPSPTTSAAATQHPTPDGGIEVLTTTFLPPSTALASDLVFSPPQFYLLSTLLPYLPPPDSVGIEDHVAKLQRKRLVRFAR